MRGRNIPWVSTIIVAVVFIPVAIAIGWWMFYAPMQETERLQAEADRIAAINSQIPARKTIEVTAAQEKILADSLPLESPAEAAERVVADALRDNGFSAIGEFERGERLSPDPWDGATPVEYSFTATGPSARIPGLIADLEETFDYSSEDRVIQQRSSKPFIAVSGFTARPAQDDPTSSQVTVKILVFNTSDFVEGLSDVRPQ